MQTISKIDLAMFAAEIANERHRQSLLSRLVRWVPEATAEVRTAWFWTVGYWSPSCQPLYGEQAGFSLARHIDADKAEGLSSLFGNLTARVGTMGVGITQDVIDEAARILVADDTVDLHDLFFYCSPASYISMLKMPIFQIPPFVEGDRREPLISSRIGALYHSVIPCYRSSNVPRLAADISYSLMAHRDAIECWVGNPAIAIQEHGASEPMIYGELSEDGRDALVSRMDEIPYQSIGIYVEMPYSFRLAHPEWAVCVVGD